MSIVRHMQLLPDIIPHLTAIISQKHKKEKKKHTIRNEEMNIRDHITIAIKHGEHQMYYEQQTVNNTHTCTVKAIHL